MTVFLLIPVLLVSAGLFALMGRLAMRLNLIWAAAAAVTLTAWLTVLGGAWSLPGASSWTGPGTSAALLGEVWLHIDRYSWPFAFALASLTLSSVLTSLARLPETDWRVLAETLALSGLSLAAVLAGSIPVLLLAWSALDIAQLVIALARAQDRNSVSRILSVFSGNVAGSLMLILSLTYAGQEGANLSVLPRQATGWLLLAAVLRLGALQVRPALLPEESLRRGLGTMLRLGPAAGVLVLLVRSAGMGVVDVLKIPALVIGTLAGLYAALGWLSSKNELDGRPFWILGGASLAVFSVVQQLQEAVLAWGLSLLFGGGLLFLSSIRRDRLRWLYVLMALLMSPLALSPAWPASALVSADPWPWGILAAILISILLLGYLRLAIMSIDGNPDAGDGIQAVHGIGLAVLPASLIFSGWSPVLLEAAFRGGIWEGGLVLVCGAAIVLLSKRGVRPSPILLRIAAGLFSLGWLARWFSSSYRVIVRGMAFVSSLLEGESSVIWALVLLALLITLFGQLGISG